jgi:hypothetical protein
MYIDERESTRGNGRAVATKLDFEQTYSADPTTVMAMLKDPEFIRLKCDTTGSRKTTVDVEETADGGCILVSVRVLPAKVPAAAAPFVGETLTVTETQTWAAPDTDGSASATVAVDFGAPMTFTSAMTLTACSTGTVVTTIGLFKASIPFVGGKIEGAAKEQTEAYLEVEQRVGNEWLSR